MSSQRQKLHSLNQPLCAPNRKVSTEKQNLSLSNPVSFLTTIHEGYKGARLGILCLRNTILLANLQQQLMGFQKKSQCHTIGSLLMLGQSTLYK